MVGIITQSTSLNSFWSISFCVLALCLHGYTTYLGVRRYQEASARAWPGPSFKGGTPGELTSNVVLLVLASVCLPFFVVFSFLRVGNYGNDGVKLGRDHAINPNLDAWCRKVRSQVLRRLWRNCPPLAQTFYLAAAFLLLLPDTLLTAVEVEYGYKTTDNVWSTDIDFLFEAERSHMSDVMGSINMTHTVANGSRVVVPTPHPPPGGWGSDHSLSLSFVNFFLALVTFGIRYASVFWYTNKALTVVFSLQLLALSLTAALGYSAWGCLYKVCYNRHVYINVDLTLGCSTSLALTVAGGAVMLLSTMTIFEYGSHYFAEKLRIIERKHRASSCSGGSGSAGGSVSEESFVKQTIVINSGCQGYVPHSCAMVALVALAAFKGPVLYDLVSLYRPTRDLLVLTGLVTEVVYLVLWIALWFGLTVKQRWQFRILDYVPLGQPLFMIQDDQVVKNPTAFGGGGGGGSTTGSTAGSVSGSAGNSLEMKEMRARRRASRNSVDSPPGYLDVVGVNRSGDVTPDNDQAHSEAGTDDSDNLNEGADGGGRVPKHRLARGGGGGGGRRQRMVTFDDRVHNSGSSKRRASGGGGGDGDGEHHHHNHNHRAGEGSRLNVKVDVHNHAPNISGASGDSATAASDPSGVKLRKSSSNPADNTLSREYRNSIRSKCDDFYAVVDHDSLNNLSPQAGLTSDSTAATTNGPAADSNPLPPSSSSFTTAATHEPLPTLMSSFRDKVKESSRTANTYRNLQLGNKFGSLERRRNSGGDYHPQGGMGVPGLTNGVVLGPNPSGTRRGSLDRRRGVVEGEVGELALRLDDSLDSGVRGSSQRTSTVSGSDDNDHSHLNHHHYGGGFQHPHPNPHHHHYNHHYNNHRDSNSVVNSTFDSENSSLPSIRENGQLSLPVHGGGVGGGGLTDGKPPRLMGKMDYLSIDKGGPGYPRNMHIVGGRTCNTKGEIGRRDSANYSLTSSQETSSNDSDHGQGLCSQNGSVPKPNN